MSYKMISILKIEYFRRWFFPNFKMLIENGKTQN